MGEEDGSIPLDPVANMSQQQPQQQPMMMMAPAGGAPAPQYIYLQPGQMPPPGAQVYMMPPQAQVQPQQPVYYPQPAAGAMPQQQQYMMMGGAPQQQQQYITIPPGQQQPYLMPAPVGMQPTIVYVNGSPKGPYLRHAVAVLVLYILGVTAGFWFCDIFSLALSLHMARKKVIDKKHRPAVIALSILELIGWVFVGAFSWYYTEWTIYRAPSSISYSSYYSSYRDPATGTYCYRQYSDDYPYGATNYYKCSMYYGWISFIIYFVFAIAFGIPRVVFTWKARNNRSNHN